MSRVRAIHQVVGKSSPGYSVSDYALALQDEHLPPGHPDRAEALHERARLLRYEGKTREAAGLYRKLAGANPDAYGPVLAIALNNLGNCLSELGRREAALGAADEAVRTLAPHFLVLPAAHGPSMAMMARNYLERCEGVGRKPDPGYSLHLRIETPRIRASRPRAACRGSP
jgi:tetratricopeptide (TPR) repeat protein